MLSRAAILSLLIVLAAGLNAHAAYYLSAGPRANPYFAATGRVDRVDYRYGDFDLATDRETYSIQAGHSSIRLQSGRLGAIRDIKNGCYVRVEGERLSDRTARANVVVVMDDAGGLEPVSRADDARVSTSERVDIRGTVSRIYSRDNEIILRAPETDYVVVVRPQTVIRQYIYRAGIDDILEGDELTVAGTITGHYRIYADRIQLTRRDRGRGVPYRDRTDQIEGVITYPPASFDRTFAIETQHGERKVDVRRDAALAKDGRDIGVHDLRKGDKVLAYGTWDGSTLNANRVEVVDQFAEVEPTPVLPPAPPIDSAPPAPGTAADNPPAPLPGAETPPAENPPAEPPAQSNVRTGRITAIDYDKSEMTIDVALRDVKVDARDASVTRKGSSRRFSDLKKGDQVTVTGDLADGVVKASSVEIVD